MTMNTRYHGIKKLAEGTFHIRVSLTDPRTGRRREKKRTIQGRIEDALALREELRSLLGQGAGGPGQPRPRVGEFARSWIQRKVNELSPATAERYASALDLHILAVLGDFYYDTLTRQDIQAWVNERLARGYAVGTAKSWLRILATMTRDAMAEIGLPTDPTLRIRFPEHIEGAKSEAITPAELERFLAAMRKDSPHHYALVVVLARTGLRFCHASALRWEDWDEDRNVLHIRRSQVRGRVSPVRRKKNAPRQIPVLPAVAEILRWHRQQMLRTQAPGLAAGWMFPSEVGTLRAVSSLAKAFKRCRAKANITARFTPHGLRYTFTDTLRAAGIDPITRRELTGHRTERMQANYSTIRLDEHRDALSRMAELIPLEPDE